MESIYHVISSILSFINEYSNPILALSTAILAITALIQAAILRKTLNMDIPELTINTKTILKLPFYIKKTKAPEKIHVEKKQVRVYIENRKK